MPIRLALIDDHAIVGVGVRHLLSEIEDVDLVACAHSVDGLDLDASALDLVLLDLRLSDGSDIRDNLRRIGEAGIPVLAYTGADDNELIRDAARAGVAGVIRKSDSPEMLIDAIRRAVGGETVASPEWASAIDSDPRGPVSLSPREREVLALYASGETAPSIADTTGLSANTVAKYVGRIRVKYALAGRAADTKIELHQRAAEDGVLPRRA